MPLKKDQLKRYQQALLKQKHAITNAVSDEEREGRDAVTLEAKDYGDMATEAVGQEMNFAISDAGRKTLKEIEDALLRVQDGTYGHCERCQKLIDEARLEAVPQAAMCISCAAIAERESGR